MSGNDDVAYLDTMEEVLWMTLEFVDKARHAQDDVTLGAYLKMALRAMRCALEIYRDHLAQNRAEIEQGEKSDDLQGDVYANG